MSISTDIPEDFPCRDKLVRAGFNRYATVQTHRSWESVRGISPKEARDIEGYLSGNNALPEDLPGREEFVEAGHSDLGSIKDLSDYTKVKGIGPTTAEKIKTYFEE